MQFSFVIPCYNSQESIGKVVEQIADVMAQRDVDDYSIVLVNDCSADDTWNTICELAKDDERIVCVDLAKNSGQHAAILAGCRYCEGDLIVCADDDMQTPIDRMWELKDKLDEGYDVVSANYIQRGRRSIGRRIGSSVNKAMRRWLIAPDDKTVSVYFLAKKYVIDEIAKYENPYPYIMGLMARTTSKIARVEMTQNERKYGNSGYSMRKLMSLWLNGFTAFSLKPLRIANVVGTISSVLGLLIGLAIVIRKIINPRVAAGWTSLMSVALIIGGLQMLLLGLIGEYVGRIYLSISGTPQSVVREVVRSVREEASAGASGEVGESAGNSSSTGDGRKASVD